MKSLKQLLEKLEGRGEVVIPLSFLLISAYLFYLAFDFVPALELKVQGTGPQVFPMIYTAVMMALSLLLIYLAVKRGLTSQFEKMPNAQNMWITLGFMAAYGFLLETMGFIVLTPIWIAAYMVAIGMRRRTWVVGATVAASVFMIVVFPVLMQVPLPWGVGIFRTISLWVLF